ncbi:MAG TPA: NADP-dependent oxidoreductase [Nocardia sp.]|uniref:NADP-dependent oxidoreductase n=1 Tax=Nocardia sp. TaxID=1821 RepID=UPI002B4B7A26|nr:NADP-dependent oxidoreductase [Nocardia sp.]HLS75860.1 NADP-dependent oxidoreductase [Nocardia sp.]
MTQTRTVLIARHVGGPDVLEFFTEHTPAPGPGEVLVQVRAAGINPIDARRMTGEFGDRVPMTFGTEFAGVVRAVGRGVDDRRHGDAVLGSGGAFTHATHIVVPAGNLIAKPGSLSWEVAGSLAGAAQTAVGLLRHLGLPAGASLLVHGGAGGVGSITVQLAVRRGLTVVATASPANQDYLRELGATPVGYGPGLTARVTAVHPAPFDAAIDMAGTTEAVDTSLAVVGPEGPIVSIAGRPVDAPRVQPFRMRPDLDALREVVDGVADGALRWEVTRTYPFLNAVTAYTDIRTGHTRGKTVLTFPAGL